jgi:monooxygenase
VPGSSGGHDVDVIIVGAGLSGIDAACRLEQLCPQLSYAVLEARADIGGTWDLFRYPGVRSDSDVYTYSYPFRPWTPATMFVAGGEILDYLRDTARTYGVDRHLRLDTRITSAAWSSAQARWTLTANTTGGTESYTCRFLYLCTGYFDYAHGYSPALPGIEEFRGRVVSPQSWPDDLDVAGQRVVVIGSGATAVTLVPALAGEAASVTMLQRSPSYVASLPSADSLAETLRCVLPERVSYRVLRLRGAVVGQGFYAFCRRFPGAASRMLRSAAAQRIGEAAVREHFTPHYGPWDQRLCIAVDGDLFRAISEGRAAVVTGDIERFVAGGVRLRSGRVLGADVVVTATGLQLRALGGIGLEVDEASVDPGRTVTYRGVMLSGVPNLAYCLGYTNASWTLRADLSARWLCRLLRHLQRHDLAYAVPEYPGGPTLPLLDLTSGYIQRAVPFFPRRAAASPWRVRQNYLTDLAEMRLGRLHRGLRFVTADAVPRAQPWSADVSPSSPRWARSTASEVPSGGGSAAGGTSSGA